MLKLVGEKPECWELTSVKEILPSLPWGGGVGLEISWDRSWGTNIRAKRGRLEWFRRPKSGRKGNAAG